MEDIATTAALHEVVDIYRQLDADDRDNAQPLSGADVVEQLGGWIERNQKLLRQLGILEDHADLQ